MESLGALESAVVSLNGGIWEAAVVVMQINGLKFGSSVLPRIEKKILVNSHN